MIQMTVWCITIAGAGVGTAAWVDGRYETRSHLAQVRQDDERGRLENQLELYQLKLDYLRNKPNRTPQDEDQIHYLQGAIEKIEARLRGLDK